MFIIVAGGGKLGYYLLKELIHKNQEVVLIEVNKTRSKFILEELGNLVITGDACDPITLEKAGIGRAEMIMANTGSDEANLIICQIARKKYRVPTTIARVNNPKNDDIFKKLGVDSTINSIETMLAIVEQKLAYKGIMITLAQEGDVEIIQTKLTKTSPAVEKPLGTLQIPEGSLISAVIRGGEIIKPDADTDLRVNDVLITLTPIGQFNELRDALMGPDMIFHAP